MNYIKFHEYKGIISKTLKDYISKYDLSFGSENEYGIDLKNKYISISYRYKELQILFNNGNNIKELNDFIFEKLPNYISLTRTNPELSIFKKTITDNNDIYDEFSLSLKQAFNFIEENFPKVFEGKII